MTSDTAGALADLTQAEVQILDDATVSTAELNILTGATVTNTELNYSSGVTSGIQNQIDAKAPKASPTFTGTVTGPTINASTALQIGGVGVTSSAADLNITDSMTKQTSISSTDSSYPTSKAVVDYVIDQLEPIGGLEVIADKDSFPETQPAAGVVISIADAGGLVVANGTSTTGRTVGASTVTINNIASNFNSTTVDAGVRKISFLIR